MNQPLVQQGFRHDHEHAAGEAVDQLLLQNQAGFDGLAQAHFVGQHHPWRIARRDFRGDVKLVGNQIGAPAAQAQHGGALYVGQTLKGVLAQVEPLGGVGLPCEQALQWLVQNQCVTEQGLGQFDALAGVILQMGVIDKSVFVDADFDDGQRIAMATGNGVASGKDDPAQGCLLPGVAALLIAGTEGDGDRAVVEVGDDAQAQLWLGFTQPALPEGKQEGFRHGVRGVPCGV